ncbi:hypothetical protein SKAU_G00291530 [Synaphobranchus kaupii]|uniref:Uncharacterized protein n=1 Tax=Synaphobranchus kaupii TaxID=118154 RepID=A0A9Q1ETV5_SYNKA|nr:hypothetical protein SKAU_G00291530 [Synaphobranchus kaupii]
MSENGESIESESTLCACGRVRRRPRSERAIGPSLIARCGVTTPIVAEEGFAVQQSEIENENDTRARRKHTRSTKIARRTAVLCPAKAGSGAQALVHSALCCAKSRTHSSQCGGVGKAVVLRSADPRPHHRIPPNSATVNQARSTR